ncbi:plasmid replication protein RepC [Rhizobium tumorigenes]|uniref:plasmid replication protein RepC n=1 Tax=Rhizobium tumorigenes TaxID=2041385 RepID=UPI00241ED1AB|nr:plasmid replication protein RepC [Rhizobium tumorigenes]WFS03327.1 plasmid replication protein RepC [Rhizobium tumorigenes]
MHTDSVTTPFGRRPVALALVRRQMAAAEIKPGKVADKWKVFRDVAAAKVLLGLQSNSLAVLDALLSFYPDNELRQDKSLIVFPSNVQLALRAHQMADATIRRHLAVLVETGIIVRRDSANGKRYARKDRAGAIETAFGFDLSPMLARCEEFARMAEDVLIERANFRKAKSDVTICRRNVRKLLTAALEEAADDDWQSLEDEYLRIVRAIPRSPSLQDLAGVLIEMQRLESTVLNRLDSLLISKNPSGNASHIERHKQSSKSESHTESELGIEQTPRSKPRGHQEDRAAKTNVFPLGLVLRACPSILDYGPGGTIATWRDMMMAAVVIKSMLGVSPSAYQEACDVMGPENAAIAMACILERTNFITSPGGYLRNLTQRSEKGEFSLGPMVMALLKANGGGERLSG